MTTKTAKPNILYISNARIPSEKAHPLQIMKMCEAFALNNSAVTLLKPFRKNSRKLSKLKNIAGFYGITKKFTIKTLASVDLINIVPSKYQRLLFLLQCYTYAHSVRKYLKNAKNKADYFFLRDYQLLYLLRKTFKKDPAKIIYEVHDLPKKKRTLKIFLELLSEVDHIVTITRYLKDKLISLGLKKERLIVLPDGVDIKNFNKPSSKKTSPQTNLIYTGQLFRWKGIYTLIDAMQYLDNKYVLNIYGGDKVTIGQIKKYLQNKNSNNIILQGFLPPCDIPGVLQKAALAILPNESKENISKFYTSPLKLFEYMAAGLPIIAADLPSLKEIIKPRRNGLFFKSGSAIDLSLRIKELAKNKELRLKIKKNNLQDITEYTWQERTKKLLNSF